LFVLRCLDLPQHRGPDAEVEYIDRPL
jgi:hypothetical protein